MSQFKVNFIAVVKLKLYFIFLSLLIVSCTPTNYMNMNKSDICIEFKNMGTVRGVRAGTRAPERGRVLSARTYLTSTESDPCPTRRYPLSLINIAQLIDSSPPRLLINTFFTNWQLWLQILLDKWSKVRFSSDMGTEKFN